MHVSVVVPTYKRPKSLHRCLDALTWQKTPPDEILVVVRLIDNTSREVVERHPGKGLRLIDVDVPAERGGFVAALNAGVDASSGEIVAFTDDDAEPHVDWISRLTMAFAGDPLVGAVGGRDWLYHDNRLENGATLKVGTLAWWGRITGKHHLGIGPARDVDVLKGVNLSVRGDLLRSLRFDERLLGAPTEHHSELSLCLRLKRLGYRVIYDPAIAVDHRREARVDDTRAFTRRAAHDDAHNETLALLEHLPPARQVLYLFWAFMIGTSGNPGLLQTARTNVRARDRLPLLRWTMIGRAAGARTYMHSQRTARVAGRYDLP